MNPILMKILLAASVSKAPKIIAAVSVACILIIIIPIVVLISLPLLVLNAAFGAGGVDNKDELIMIYEECYSITNDMNEDAVKEIKKKVAHDEVIINDDTGVAYEYVFAIDTVRFGQDFKKATKTDIYETIKMFRTVSYETSTETRERLLDLDGVFMGSSEPVVVEYEYTTLTINISSKSYEDVCREYGMSDASISIVRNIAYNLAVEKGTLLKNNVDINIILHQLPFGEIGTNIVINALERLGDPYSQSKAGTGSFLDCSYLSKWAYAKNGISLPRTAADQAKYCYDNGLTISRDDLRPGDLIFYSGEDNGRFMNVYHVVIYVGNIDGEDMVVHASGSAVGVVYQKFYGKPSMYGRAYL